MAPSLTSPTSIAVFIYGAIGSEAKRKPLRLVFLFTVPTREEGPRFCRERFSFLRFPFSFSPPTAHCDRCVHTPAGLLPIAGNSRERGISTALDHNASHITTPLQLRTYSAQEGREETKEHNLVTAERERETETETERTVSCHDGESTIVGYKRQVAVLNQSY